MKSDWEKTLNECVYRLSHDQDFALAYSLTGVPSKQWPKCLAKELGEEFYEKKNSKSIRYAMVSLAKATDKLSRKELNYDYNIAVEEITNAINTGIGIQLAKEISLNPAAYNEVISKNDLITHLDVSVDLKLVAEDVFKRMLIGLESNENANRYVSGYPMLSALVGGFNDSRVTLVVAGSGVGKTTFMLNFVLSAIKDYSCLFINMEMSIEDILKRIACIHLGISQRILERRSSQITDYLSKTYNFLLNSKNLYMTDGNNLSIQQIASSAYKRASEGAKFIIIDYDQKIKMSGNDSEWKEILLAVEALEDIAKKTKTHVIILAQGDENNNPKASKRSIQPCSAVLAFYEENGKFYIESKKNRFGKRFKLLMNCDFEIYKIEEKEEVSLEKQTRSFI